MSARRVLLAVATAGALYLAPAPARANGTFPNAGQFILRPGHPDQMAVRTSFGILISNDAGQSWGLACEGGVGYTNETPGIAITGNGTVLAALSNGVARTAISDGCNWSLAPGVPAGAVDVSVQKDDPSVAVALTHDMGSGVAQVWESIDQGASWHALGVALPAGVVPTTLDVAPADPQRIYVAGMQGANNPVVARTDNRGDDWTVWEIATDVPENPPYIAAIDPLNADLVYVRSAGDPSRLLVSNDGGEGWNTGFYASGPMRGFALSPDGSEIIVADVLGVWLAPASTLAFAQQSEVFIQCLAWTDAGIYGCSNQYVTQFFLGLSGNLGVSFEQILSMHCIRLLDCRAATTVGDVCPDDWPALETQLATQLCAEGGGGGSGGGAGSGGTGSGGASSNTGNGAGNQSGGAGADASDPGDCDCRAAGAGGTSAWWLGPCALVAMLRLARKRRVWLAS